MSEPANTGERLMHIETLLEAQARATELHNQNMTKEIDNLQESVRLFRKDFDDHKTDYLALKNKGAGVLVGVALVAGGLGAAVQAIIGAFKGG
jgi:hypothetical protein